MFSRSSTLSVIYVKLLSCIGCLCSLSLCCFVMRLHQSVFLAMLLSLLRDIPKKKKKKSLSLHTRKCSQLQTVCSFLMTVARFECLWVSHLLSFEPVKPSFTQVGHFFNAVHQTYSLAFEKKILCWLHS